MATSNTKVIKEIITDVGGNTTIEYSDDTTQKYNVADVVTAQSNPLTGGISFNGIGIGYKQPLLAAVGDSRVAQGKTIASDGVATSTNGVTNWIEPLMLGRVLHPASYNFAVSGSGYQSILDLQLPQVLALQNRPTHCIVMSGTNDFFGVSQQTIKDNAVKVWILLKANGVIPVHILDLPRTVGSWSATHAKLRLDFNNWVSLNAGQYGVVVIDANAQYSDPSNANGDPLSGLNVADGIHPTMRGAYQVGVALKRYFDTLDLPTVPKPSSALDVYDATYNPRGNGILLGGIMQGTAGTNTGTGASGSVASNFNSRVLSGAATAVSSLVSRTDAAGWWQRIVYTATDLSTFRFSHNAPSANLEIGAIFVAAVDIVVTNPVLLDYLQLFVASNPGPFGQGIAFKNTGANYPWPSQSMTLRLITPPITILAGATDILFRIESQIQAGGSVTVDIGSCEIRKVS